MIFALRGVLRRPEANFRESTHDSGLLLRNLNKVTKIGGIW